VTTPQHKVHTQFGRAAAPILAANDRMNQILLERPGPAAWRAKLPGSACAIAAIFAHLHSVSSKRVGLIARPLKVPR